MSFYKFTNNDLFVNYIEANPSCKFDIYNSVIYYNNRSEQAGAFTGSVPGVPAGHISLYELNVDRNVTDTGLIFAFMQRDSSLTAFKTISTKDYYSTDYGAQVSGAAYPLSASITREFFDDDHFATMRTNNEATIDSDSDDYGGRALSITGPGVGSDGLPTFATDDMSTATSKSSLERYLDLKTLLSSSHINSLKNTINRYSVMSPHFMYSGSFSSGYSRDLDEIPVNLISIPSIFYGSSLKKGTVSLKYYLTGTLIGELKDENHNGELIQVGPEGSTGSGSVAGLALYKQGFVILTGSWNLQTTGPSANAELDYKNIGTAVTSSWLYFGVGANDGIPTDGEGATTRASASYAMHFSGTSDTPFVTMFAHARKGHLNYSNNPTYLSYSATSADYDALTSSFSYREPDLATVNIVSSSFESPTASFAKETYISKIGIYDKNKNLIGVTTVAKPVKKTEDREFTFKLKMDL
tara:strand:+ start:412 stop:1818 length:1407 start_codon:yes stop_codon:yes gene_type:complete